MTDTPLASPSAILNAAADLIEPEGAWCQGSLGLDSAGVKVGASKRAVSHCIDGALAFSSDYYMGPLFTQCRRFVFRVVKGALPSCWNDAPGRTQAEVVSALRRAAQLAESAQ